MQVQRKQRSRGQGEVVFAVSSAERRSRPPTEQPVKAQPYPVLARDDRVRAGPTHQAECPSQLQADTGAPRPTNNTTHSPLSPWQLAQHVYRQLAVEEPQADTRQQGRQADFASSLDARLMDKGLDVIGAVGRAAVELSRAGFEAANYATSSVDDAVEQLVAGWGSTPGKSQLQPPQATWQSRAHGWEDFDFDSSAVAQQPSAPSTSKHSTKQLPTQQQTFVANQGAGRPDTSGAEAAAVMADSPASAVSDCSRDLSPPELRQELQRAAADCRLLRRKCRSLLQENQQLRQARHLDAAEEPLVDQTRRQMEALLLQKTELARQKLQLELDNERLQVLLDYTLDCPDSPGSDSGLNDIQSSPAADEPSEDTVLEMKTAGGGSAEGWDDDWSIAAGHTDDAAGSDYEAVLAMQLHS